jgi:hypothetical protein
MNGVKAGLALCAVIVLLVGVFSALRAGTAMLAVKAAEADADKAQAAALAAQAVALQTQAQADLTLKEATARQMNAATNAVYADTRAAHSLVRAVMPWGAVASFGGLLVLAVVALAVFQAQQVADLRRRLEAAQAARTWIACDLREKSGFVGSNDDIQFIPEE